MVSIKFSRGKFSRPATGYECIAHAPAFDRGVPANPPPDLLQSPDSHGLIACPDKYWPVREAREILQPPTQSTVAFINNVGVFQSSSIKIALARSRLLVKKVKGIAKP